VQRLKPYSQYVTYNSRTTNDSFNTINNVLAAAKQVNSTDNAFSQELLAVATRVWEITSQYLGVVPDTDDTIVDASGQEWVVLAISSRLGSSVYDILSREAV
jgi:hypothetical protein